MERPLSKVLYLHGFASSSRSLKAQQVREYFQAMHPDVMLEIPDIPYCTQEAWQLLSNLYQNFQPDLVIGSSLGGFFATVLREQFGGRAVLINPAVRPDLLLVNYLGRYYHPVLQRYFDVTADQLPTLAELAPLQLTELQTYWVLLQTADEVLNYQDALHYYQGARLDVQQGGDHSYQGFAARLVEIVNFGRLA